MRTGFCRYCQIEIYNDNDYFGFCSLACCVEFSHKHNITLDEAMDLDFKEQDRSDLEDRIDELECSYSNASREAENLYRDLDLTEEKQCELEEKIKELQDLNWEKIKKEREKESEYNESVLRKLDNIKTENDNIKEEMEKAQKDSILVHDQNLDLLNTIKKIKAHSSRFQQMDLGIELDYDE